eukprot:TRINITY_DN65896_c12_g1_i4.p1 TRINITY_DN65896_c12_g1~~TRINITY_DN65896_c12_g1_i4.p1  ORF type:complete len:565 (+),score=258.01 TRINITY_DN65896_c12_g1_i4:191-1885(+)
MKRLHKAGVANKSQFVKTVWRERDVLCAINRMAANFLVSSRFCFQDDTYLYVILEFMAGGDLRYYMSQHGAMKENVARFYIAELVLALEELHSLNLLYRDMKPDNVLLDEDGHLRLTDFGLAVPLKAKYNFRNRGFAGTPLYQAPEVLQNQWYSYPVDYWGLGIMIYELTQLRLPFRSDHDIVYQKHIRFKVPVSSSCVSIVNALLQQNPDQRLGSGPRGIDEIKSHPWFGGVDWSRMARKGYRPPFKPDVNRANCHPHLELEEQIINSSQDKTHRLSAEDQNLFRDFEYNTEVTREMLEAIEILETRGPRDAHEALTTRNNEAHRRRVTEAKERRRRRMRANANAAAEPLSLKTNLDQQTAASSNGNMSDTSNVIGTPSARSVGSRLLRIHDRKNSTSNIKVRKARAIADAHEAARARAAAAKHGVSRPLEEHKQVESGDNGDDRNAHSDSGTGGGRSGGHPIVQRHSSVTQRHSSVTQSRRSTQTGRTPSTAPPRPLTTTTTGSQGTIINDDAGAPTATDDTHTHDHQNMLIASRKRVDGADDLHPRQEPPAIPMPNAVVVE